MRLIKAHIRAYRSIRDTGEFEVENGKTIFVGPNEAGKTVILQALQQLNAAKGVQKFEPLRDYPRSDYNKDIGRNAVNPSTVTVTEGHFSLEQTDLVGLQPGFESCTFVYGRRLDNTSWHQLRGAPTIPSYRDVTKDLTRLCAHIDARKRAEAPAQA